MRCCIFVACFLSGFYVAESRAIAFGGHRSGCQGGQAQATSAGCQGRQGGGLFSGGRFSHRERYGVRQRGYQSAPVRAPANAPQQMPQNCPGGVCPVPPAKANPTSHHVANVENDALAEVNTYRHRRGLRPFLQDLGLTLAAQRCAEFRASRFIAGHANDFQFLPAGTTAAAAGCGALEPSWGWATCCTDDDYTFAGAAYVFGADGKRYMQLFVR